MSDRLRDIEERLKAATPGPWVAGRWFGSCTLDHGRGDRGHGKGDCDYKYTLRTDGSGDHHHIVRADEPVEVVITTAEYGALSKRDATLIAHAPEDLAYLLRVARAAEDVLDAQRCESMYDLPGACAALCRALEGDADGK